MPGSRPNSFCKLAGELFFKNFARIVDETLQTVARGLIECHRLGSLPGRRRRRCRSPLYKPSWAFRSVQFVESRRQGQPPPSALPATATAFVTAWPGPFVPALRTAPLPRAGVFAPSPAAGSTRLSDSIQGAVDVVVACDSSFFSPTIDLVLASRLPGPPAGPTALLRSSWVSFLPALACAAVPQRRPSAAVLLLVRSR
jgi:hypothetical protein